MQTANRTQITRHPDHFAVRFGFAATTAPNDAGDEIARIVLPLTTALDFAIALFESVQLASPEVQKAFEKLLPRIAALNTATEQAQAKTP